MSGGRLLVLDDDRGVVEWLVEALGEEGFDVVGETSAKRAIELLSEGRFDLLVTDVEMPEMRGIELLRRLEGKSGAPAVLLMTAFGSIDLAVEAVKAGAADFLAKPFRIEVLVLAIERTLRERGMRREIRRLREAVSEKEPSGLVARSPAMLRVLELARRAARSGLPILITGESGVGKGALASYLHRTSERSSGRYVQVNCAALPSGLAEAELFGARRGAFTDAREDRPGLFEQARGGTLFLDEIGELPLEVQPKLLQALESKTVRPLGSSNEVRVDVRIVAATNRPLEAAVRERTFRPDLFHRLNVVRIALPPLREREEDIDGLVDQVLARIAERTGEASLSVAPEAMRWLRRNPWRGNVRELINTLERAAALTDHATLLVEDFESPGEAEESLLDVSAEAELSLDELEKAYIRRILERTDGNKAKAAKILGLDRRTLYRKVAELEGTPPKKG